MSVQDEHLPETGVAETMIIPIAEEEQPIEKIKRRLAERTASMLPVNENKVRREGLGWLYKLWDRFIYAVMEELDAPDLLTLMHVSKALYIFANDEDLWKAIAVKKWGQDWRFKGTWRATSLLPADSPKRDRLSNRLC